MQFYTKFIRNSAINISKYNSFLFKKITNPVFYSKKSFFAHIITILLLISGFHLQAQLNNRVFYERDSTLQNSTLYFNLDGLGFTRNNEYFNDILSGNTYIGYQFSPSLLYTISPNFWLELGVFAQRGFGQSEDFTLLQPLFRLKYHRPKTELIFGTLEGNFAHNLIEPLYAFEQRFARPLEQGLQFRHKGTKLQAELWVDWQQALDNQQGAQEQFLAGLVSNYVLVKRDSWQLSAPLQATLQHRGGQNISGLNRNQMNLAAGLALSKQIKNHQFWRKITTSHYFVGFSENLSDTTLTRQGEAYYGNIELESSAFTLLLSLWLGRNFDSPQGGDLYASFSGNVGSNYYEKHRDLLFIRLMRDFKLQDNASISLRFEPYYDFNQRKLEFALGLYFSFRPQYLVYQSKK